MPRPLRRAVCWSWQGIRSCSTYVHGWTQSTLQTQQWATVIHFPLFKHLILISHVVSKESWYDHNQCFSLDYLKKPSFYLYILYNCGCQSICDWWPTENHAINVTWSPSWNKAFPCIFEYFPKKYTWELDLPETRCFADNITLVMGLVCTVNIWKSCGPCPTDSWCCTAPEIVQ